MSAGNMTPCRVCGKACIHATGLCRICRQRKCDECQRVYQPRPVGRKVCSKCWNKKVKGE